jgi:hypothetical protein
MCRTALKLNKRTSLVDLPQAPSCKIYGLLWKKVGFSPFETTTALLRRRLDSVYFNF